MANLNAVNQVGESRVGPMRDRRDILPAEGRLGPVPAALDISHASLNRLATGAEPTSGFAITCYRIAMSDHPTPRHAARNAASGVSIAVELHYPRGTEVR